MHQACFKFSTAAQTMLYCSSDDNPYPFIGQTQTDRDHQMFKNDQQTVQPYHSHLADPFFEDDDLFLNYLTHHHLLAGTTSQDPNEISIDVSNIAADTNNESTNDNEVERDTSVKSSSKKRGTTVKQTIPRNKSGKKDRHSKICTAQGTRDRRMRLSLPIARKFFDLQDLLGFDKASKTIEWLFSKSRSAIKELEQNFSKMKQYTIVAAKSLSSTTESEVVSRVGEASESSGFKKCTEEKLAGCVKEKKSRKLHTVAKESRDMARARARVRAREKMILKGVEVSSEEGSKVTPSGETYISNQGMSVTLKEIPARDEEANNHGFLEHYMNSVNINENDLHCLSSQSSALKISHDEGPSGGNNEDDFFQSFTRNWEIEFHHVEMQSPYRTVPQMKTLLAADVEGQILNEVIDHFKIQTSQAYLPL